MYRYITLIFLLSFISAGHVIVLDGGTGDGSAWDNALDQIPATLTRGDTVWIGDGDYNAVTFNDAPSGSTYIYIYKATESAHGTSAGWQASYGDGVANFSGTMNFDTDYWIMEGVTGSKKTGHGFYITTTSCATHSKIVQVRYGADNVRISHTEMEHCGESNEYNQDILYVAWSDDGGSDNLTISYCYLHDVNRQPVHLNWSQNFVFEHNYIEDHYNADEIGIHSSGFAANNCGNANMTLRYNIFEDIEGTTIIGPKDSHQQNIYIYGNIFYRSGADYYNTTNGAIANTGGDTNDSMYVYNNTFVDLLGPSGVNWLGDGVGNVCRNNLWVNCETVNLNNAGTQSNNEPNGSTNLFIDYAGDDFILSQSTGAGYILPSPFNQDMNGNTRGADGEFDIGAFEYQSTSGQQSQSGRIIKIGNITY